MARDKFYFTYLLIYLLILTYSSQNIY